ncbi:MAG: S1 RNA-binding domain-containing protein, partial [Candidatus Limnocylindria bacterium]
MIEDPQPAAPAKDTPAGTDPAADAPEAPTAPATEAATLVVEPEAEPTPDGDGEAVNEPPVADAQLREEPSDEPVVTSPNELEPAATESEPIATAEAPEAAEPPAPELEAGGPEAPEPAAREPAAFAAEPQGATSEPAEDRPEPTTMAELMEQPDHEVKNLRHGDVVEGTVVRIDPDELLVDFGGKSEGVVSNRELLGRRGGPREGDEPRQELKVGDPVLVYVLQPESPEGHAVLSVRRAGLERKWRAMQE